MGRGHGGGSAGQLVDLVVELRVECLVFFVWRLVSAGLLLWQMPAQLHCGRAYPERNAGR